MFESLEGHAVRQGCVLLLNKLKRSEYYPRVAIIGCVGTNENPASLRVLDSAGFEPLGSLADQPAAIIRYEDQSPSLDSVWLLNWNALNYKLRAKAPLQGRGRTREIATGGFKGETYGSHDPRRPAGQKKNLGESDEQSHSHKSG